MSVDKENLEEKNPGTQEAPQKTYTEEQFRRTLDARLARERKKYAALEPWREVIEFIERAGPQAKARIQQVINEIAESMPGDNRHEELERELALREAMDEIAEKDEAFLKRKSEFLDWCENEGIEVSDPRTLRLAYRAWRNDPVNRALAGEGTKTDASPPQGRVSPKGTGIPTPKSPREMSDEEFLRSQGLELFEPEGG